MHSVTHCDCATLVCSMTHYDCHSHRVLYDTLWLWHTHHVWHIVKHRPSLNVLYGLLCLWHTHAFYDTLCFVTHCDWHTSVTYCDCDTLVCSRIHCDCDTLILCFTTHCDRLSCIATDAHVFCLWPVVIMTCSVCILWPVVAVCHTHLSVWHMVAGG